MTGAHEDEAGSPTLAPGVSRAWLHERQIVVYTVARMTRAAVHAWVDDIVATLEQWPKGRPYLALHDMSHLRAADMVTSAYDLSSIYVSEPGYARVKHLLDPATGFRSYLALVFSTTYSGRVTHLLIRTEPRPEQFGHMQHKTFFTREAAEHWLETMLAENTP